jgi:hypothetical protein
MSPDEKAFETWASNKEIADIEAVKQVWMEATLIERRGCVRLCFSVWDAMALGCGKAIKRRATEHNRSKYE